MSQMLWIDKIKHQMHNQLLQLPLATALWKFSYFCDCAVAEACTSDGLRRTSSRRIRSRRVLRNTFAFAHSYNICLQCKI